jgi:hypothetical protein
MNMTGLVEVLAKASDTAFTVKFKKLPTEERAQELINSISYADLKNQQKLAPLVKGIIEGEECEMTCHLVRAENHLGRSLVIDLNSHIDNRFRQIDHRTIQHIIYRNVKYVLKQGAKKISEEEEKKAKEEAKNAPKWD